MPPRTARPRSGASRIAARSILVIGADYSSNSNRLREIGEEAGSRSHLIADAGGLDPGLAGRSADGGHHRRRIGTRRAGPEPHPPPGRSVRHHAGGPRRHRGERHVPAALASCSSPLPAPPDSRTRTGLSVRLRPAEPNAVHLRDWSARAAGTLPSPLSPRGVGRGWRAQVEDSPGQWAEAHLPLTPSPTPGGRGALSLPA